ncbi:unnamed protein product [Discosporangium mesarthrocarpum]
MASGESIVTATSPYENYVIDAARDGVVEVVRVYLSEGGCVNLRDCDTKGTLLQWSCSYGRLGTAALLLQRGADVEAVDNEKWTCLHWACHSGHSGATDTARMLLENGAHLDAGDSQNWTPMHVACNVGRTDTVRFLLDVGCDAAARTDKNLTALHIACESGFTDTAR